MVYIIYCTVFLISHYCLIETMPTVHLVLATCINEWKIVISCYKSECNSPSRFKLFFNYSVKTKQPIPFWQSCVKGVATNSLYSVSVTCPCLTVELKWFFFTLAVGSSARLILLAPHFGSLHGIKSRAIIIKLKF